MKTLLVGTLMVGALATSSVAQCESSCSVDPQHLEFWWGLVGPPDGEEGTFTICNTSMGDCPPISGNIVWSCPTIYLNVYPTSYTLGTGECITVQVEAMEPALFYCDLLTDCGSVVLEGFIIGDASDAPEAFKLGEAYPNPFNPSTTIAYSVPETQEVTLNVFNTNGQVVQTLVNGMVERGDHKVVFDASSLSSGVYIYTLQTPNQTAVRKMVLVK
jgi:hypothetical protein